MGAGLQKGGELGPPHSATKHGPSVRRPSASLPATAPPSAPAPIGKPRRPSPPPSPPPQIEENWDKVRQVALPTGAEASAERLAPLLSTLPLELRPDMEAFIRAAVAVYEDLDFTLMVGGRARCPWSALLPAGVRAR